MITLPSSCHVEAIHLRAKMYSIKKTKVQIVKKLLDKNKIHYRGSYISKFKKENFFIIKRNKKSLHYYF